VTEAIHFALGQLFSWPGILYPLVGTLVAMVVSFLPGIGMTAIASIFLLLSAYWEVEAALLFFGALVGGATYMGSVTGILFNIPGSTPSAAILLDGYPMGQKGYPKRALASAAMASAVGSLFGVFVLLCLLPIVKPYILFFGSVEKLMIGLWGLSCVVIFTRTSLLSGLAMAVLGLLIALVGVDLETGNDRLTFGIEYLGDGVDSIVMLLGIFSLAELIKLGHNRLFNKGLIPLNQPDDSIVSGIGDVFRHRWLTLRSSVIGTVVGIIPGIGGTVASFVSYNFAVQGAKDPDSFGQGDVRGVIAPEAAVDAKDGGSLVPALVLGLPGSEVGIVLISLFMIHGLVPGSVMLTTQLPLSILLIFSLLFSNLLTSLLGIGLIPLFVRLKYMNFKFFAVPIVILVIYLVYDIRQSYEDVGLLFIFGALSVFMDRANLPKVPLIVGFVLGKFIESNALVTKSLIEIHGLSIIEKPFTQILGLIFLGSIYYFYQNRGLKKLITDNHRHVFLVLFIIVIACFLEMIVRQSHIGSYAIFVLSALFTICVITYIKMIKGNHSSLHKVNK